MALSYTIGDIVTDAFIEIGAVAPGEQPSSDEAQWGLRKANDVADFFQAQQAYVWGYAFPVYTLVPGLSPHTIGPNSATFATTGPRPVRLESAAQLLSQGTPTGPSDLLINIRDRMWWAQNQVKNIQTNVVTDVFYDPTFDDENGALYFWPVPNQQNQVRLQLWQTISQFDAITDPIGGPGGPGTLPQGLRTAFKLTLSEFLCPGAKIEPSQTLVVGARIARAAVFGNNAKSPRISTQDSGMPKAGRTGVRGDFNWITGGMAGGRPE